VAITEAGSGPMKTLVRLWESDAKIFCVFKGPKSVAAPIHDDDDLTITTAAVCHASSSLL